MSLLFACRDIPLPKLNDCSAGSDYEWWEWKDLLQVKKLAYNGRMVRRKATLVSMRLLPAFLAAYLTGGGYAMYEEEYYWGKLGKLANEVAEYLDRHGPTPVDQLRQAVVPSGKDNTRRFHAALFELQSKFKIVTAGLEDRSWGVRVLDLFMNWAPPEIERTAESMSRDEALARITSAFMDTAGAVPEAQIPRMFGWSLKETREVIESLFLDGSLKRARIGSERVPMLVSERMKFVRTE
jgi:hypothetical protein